MHKCRTGLIHVNDGNPGSAVSKDLKDLKKILVVVNLPEGQEELHGVVHLAITAAHWIGEIFDFLSQLRLFPSFSLFNAPGSVCIISGTAATVSMAVQAAKALDSEIIDNRIPMYTPGKVYSLQKSK